MTVTVKYHMPAQYLCAKLEEPTTMSEKLGYRLLTGKDDRSFCERVSKALEEGYELYGSPAITHNGEHCVVAQAIVLKRT